MIIYSHHKLASNRYMIYIFKAKQDQIISFSTPISGFPAYKSPCEDHLRRGESILVNPLRQGPAERAMHRGDEGENAYVYPVDSHVRLRPQSRMLSHRPLSKMLLKVRFAQQDGHSQIIQLHNLAKKTPPACQARVLSSLQSCWECN